MASIYAGSDEECKQHSKTASFQSFKRSLSVNSNDSYSGQSSKSCCCAPPTHAGSFKCRLHRVNSLGRAAPPATQAPVSSSSTRTLKAQ